MDVAPGGRDPSGSGHIGRGRNSLGSVVSGSTCCPLGPTDPCPLRGHRIKLPQVVETIRATCKPTEHPEVPDVIDPGDGRLSTGGYIAGCGGALRTIGASLISRVSAADPGPLAAAILPFLAPATSGYSGDKTVAWRS